MSSLIEQAAIRLECLRQAGAETAWNSPSSIPAEASVARESSVPAQEDMGLLAAGARSSAPAPVPLPKGSSRASAGARSKHVELDLRALAYAGYGHPPGSRPNEEFRVIKRPLIRNAMGKAAAAISNGNLIMVTSALPGEGKTFTAINLAMSIAAEIDRTVMLVDADVIRPSVLQVLGIRQSPGLLDVLQDPSIELSEVLLKTNLGKLTLLPSGTPCARATELLASDAMGTLLDEVANRYPDRIVVFDSPPLLVTTEAQVLATHMGQIVIVADAERTLQRDLLEALDTIEACPVRLTVLNRVRRASQVSYGY